MPEALPVVRGLHDHVDLLVLTEEARHDPRQRAGGGLAGQGQTDPPFQPMRLGVNVLVGRDGVVHDVTAALEALEPVRRQFLLARRPLDEGQAELAFERRDPAGDGGDGKPECPGGMGERFPAPDLDEDDHVAEVVDPLRAHDVSHRAIRKYPGGSDAGAFHGG